MWLCNYSPISAPGCTDGTKDVVGVMAEESASDGISTSLEGFEDPACNDGLMVLVGCPLRSEVSGPRSVKIQCSFIYFINYIEHHIASKSPVLINDNNIALLLSLMGSLSSPASSILRHFDQH
jgi:hypothetical protein